MNLHCIIVLHFQPHSLLMHLNLRPILFPSLSSRCLLILRAFTPPPHLPSSILCSQSIHPFSLVSSSTFAIIDWVFHWSRPLPRLLFALTVFQSNYSHQEHFSFYSLDIFFLFDHFFLHISFFFSLNLITVYHPSPHQLHYLSFLLWF